MTKKKLNIDNITNELEGASLFFTKPASPPPVPPEEEKSTNPLSGSPFFNDSPAPLAATEPVKSVTSEKKEGPKVKKTVRTDNSDTTTPRNHDTVIPRYHDTITPRIHGVAIDAVRKAVKEFGKEAATHRFTVAEKKELADLIYTYKNQGIKTSENEITRVAVNFIVEDYRENGENSVLYKILQALNE